MLYIVFVLFEKHALMLRCKHLEFFNVNVDRINCGDTQLIFPTAKFSSMLIFRLYSMLYS